MSPKLFTFSWQAASLTIFHLLCTSLVFLCNWCLVVTVVFCLRLIGFTCGRRKSTAFGIGGTGFEFQLHTFSLWIKQKRKKSLTGHSDLIRLVWNLSLSTLYDSPGHSYVQRRLRTFAHTLNVHSVNYSSIKLEKKTNNKKASALY